jgi:hypothetical protein
VHKVVPTVGATSNHDDTQYPSPSFAIDGDLDKDVWRNIAWSDLFDDIQGIDDAPPYSNLKIPTTRFKALYDDHYLYIIAALYPAAGLSTKAYYTERNSPIYQRDSDFEVFIDVDQTNHMYKEFEVNAINTVWNLLLNKPYDDGGQEYSGRIARPGERNYYEVDHQHSATKVISGIINDEKNSTGALWTVEVALSFADILSNTTMMKLNKSYSPAGTSWRVNFSRVENQGQINWTWQPQIRWNPERRRYSGLIQMHMPDAWGYLCFVDDDNLGVSSDTDTVPQKNLRDSLWPEKLTAMTVYYALHHYKNIHGQFTNNLSELILPAEIIEPFLVNIQLLSKDHVRSSEGFTVNVPVTTSDDYEICVEVRDDRFLEVTHSPSKRDKLLTEY